MGCVFGKSASIEDGQSNRRLDLAVARVTRKDNGAVGVGLVDDKLFNVSTKDNGDLRVGLVDDKFLNGSTKDGGDLRVALVDDKFSNGSRKVRDDNFEKNEENSHVFVAIPKAMEGEQVAAGWPSWLARVAGEAIKEWLPRRADTFQKLDKIGQGTYSSVYKARDLIHKKVVALKRVRFDNMDPESIKFMAREILILRRLDHPNIIKLEGLIISRSSCSLYLVFEYMEHDLTGIASLPGVKFTEPQVKCYMHQLLSGLDHCHSRGVLHRDIKGSNLLIDNHGNLKIADFGLANFFNHSQSVTLTSRVVTLWYRPPELLLGATYYGVAVDLWSTGCILGELYAGRPIMPGRTEVEQIHKIFKLCGSPSEDYWKKSKLPHTAVYKPLKPYKRRLAETFKDFPATAIRLMETLLAVDPERRRSTSFALESEFFTEKPHACDPSGLPKYPPSKEIDAKLRNEEAKRNGAVGVRGERFDCEMRGSKESLRGPAPDANAELVTSMKKRQSCTNPKSRSEVFNPNQEEAASGFPIDPFGQDEIGHSHPQALNQVGRLSESYEKLGPSRKHHKHHTRKLFGSRQAESGRASLSELTLGNKTHFSGPLLVVQNNVDHMLKDHDRHIKEAARRARLEKARQDLVKFR